MHLIASVSTRRGFGPVLIRGNTAFTDRTLWDQVGQPLAKRISLARVVVIDRVTDKPIVHKDERLIDELPAACDRLERFYRSKGFHLARVRAESWKGGPPTAEDFVISIDEHPGEK